MRRLIAGVLLVVAIAGSTPSIAVVDSPSTTTIDSPSEVQEADDDEPPLAG